MSNATDDPAREKQHLEQLMRKRIDGLVVTARRADKRPPIGPLPGIPIVYVYSQADDPNAVSLIPGVGSISQTFGILVGLTFVIGIVVIGFFFLILTVQKLKSFTLLRALGASPRRLAGVVVQQITVVVLVASAIAVVLTLLAVRGLNSGIPVSLAPGLVIGVIASVLIFSLLAGLLSIRRVTTIDPFTAAGAR